MSLEKTITKKLQALEEVPDSFIAVVNKQNEKLFRELLVILDSLEKDGDFIAATSKNAAIMEQVVSILTKTLFEKEYLNGLKTFLGSFDTQASMINDIYSFQFDFEDKDLYKSLLSQSKKSALSFLNEDAIGKAVFEPLQNNLITSVFAGSKYSDMVKSMKDYILGSDETNPKLTSYVGRYARDSMAIFDNTYTQLIANDVKVELWEYSGGVLKDTRDFCKSRVGHVYTRDEIESWATLDWQGKNQNTGSQTIFVYRGGYNCIHSFIPRDPNFVKKSEINTYN